jgi:hypothetical protein
VDLSQNEVCLVTDTIRRVSLELFVAEYYRWSIGLIVVLQDLSSFRPLGSCALLAGSGCVPPSAIQSLAVSKYET